MSDEEYRGTVSERKAWEKSAKRALKALKLPDPHGGHTVAQGTLTLTALLPLI